MSGKEYLWLRDENVRLKAEIERLRAVILALDEAANLPEAEQSIKLLQDEAQAIRRATAQLEEKP